jgi:hypothetical protein
MTTRKILLTTTISLLLAACGGSGTPPGTPTAMSVAPGAAAGTAIVSFTPPASPGSSAITGYTVLAAADNGDAVMASGTGSPITVTGLTPKTAYLFSLVASNEAGTSFPATTGMLKFFSVVETFTEPKTMPPMRASTVFTGAFTYDTTNNVVSSLGGSITQAMTPNGSVTLTNQLDAAAATVNGVDGFLVSTFALPTTDVFSPSGFAPGGTLYFGYPTATNPSQGGVGNTYAMIWVNRADPAATIGQAQIDKLAYGDCTAGSMMMNKCMTGTTVAGYGVIGTMGGYPSAQVITER